VKNSDKNQLQGLGHLLPQLSRKKGWQAQLDLYSIFRRWDALLESEITDHCQPLKIVRKELWIEVENSAWLQQFQYQSVFILETLNKSLRISKLKGLRFLVAEKKFEKEVQEVPVRYIPPPAKEVEAFEAQVASIADEASREALLRFWYLSHACKRG
jgi:predicted nucleic acid-binding Zn ribbon protein